MIGAESDRPDCAVCVPPGASLVLYNIPKRLQRRYQVRETEDVTFTQVSAQENAYRDAVRFRNGGTLLLQRLDPGQRVMVTTVSGKETCEIDRFVPVERRVETPR